MVQIWCKFYQASDRGGYYPIANLLGRKWNGLWGAECGKPRRCEPPLTHLGAGTPRCSGRCVWRELNVETIVPNIQRHLRTKQIAYVRASTQIGTETKRV
jgi:hypothetical protein